MPVLIAMLSGCLTSRQPLFCWLRFATVMILLSLQAFAPARAVEVRFEPVAPDVFAFVGETGGRSWSNEGLNANIGLVVTSQGAILIDSGATAQSAKKIHAAARTVTSQPVKWVINTGGQDHRWIGNSYFQSQGILTIAHAAARSDMMARGGDHLAALKATLKERAEGTMISLPEQWIEGTDARLQLGDTVLELRHRGGGHTPGDMMVWLPQKKLLFTGDIVYVDRMLGVIPVSNTRAWLAAFQVVEDLNPTVIIPGHGQVTKLTQARAHTRDYLIALRAHMKKAVDDGTDISTAIKTFDAQPFMRLLNAADLHPGNASRTYLELERE